MEEDLVKTLINNTCYIVVTARIARSLHICHFYLREANINEKQHLNDLKIRRKTDN
jgi:hypothetical protein